MQISSDKRLFTRKVPLALYLLYFALLIISAVALSLSVSSGFSPLLAAGAAGMAVSLLLILSSTKIERKINHPEWRQNADTYYNDEGIFEYTPQGFTLINKEGHSMQVLWSTIQKAESGENKISSLLKVNYIHLYFSEADFITIDSTMPGFSLFEKRLKQNLRTIWQKEDVTHENAAAKNIKIS